MSPLLTRCRNRASARQWSNEFVIALTLHRLKLSPPAPMVLHTRGRVGSRRFQEIARDESPGLLSCMATCSLTQWATEVFTVATECGYGLTKGSESPLVTEG